MSVRVGEIDREIWRFVYGLLFVDIDMDPSTIRVSRQTALVKSRVHVCSAATEEG